MSAAGKVTTGFSLPYVALYAASGGTITYTSGQKLARGVDVSISPESGSDNNFYADNVIAESDAGKFTGGTLSLTVDGLLPTTRKLIFGLPAATGGWTEFGDDMAVPYVAVGYIARSQSDGVVKYTPTIIAKCKFNLPEDSAATQEDSINWQTESLTATIMRADDANHTWKFLGDEQSTEAAAEAALKTKLGIS